LDPGCRDTAPGSSPPDVRKKDDKGQPLSVGKWQKQ
jgi:hypothetical protein